MISVLLLSVACGVSLRMGYHGWNMRSFRDVSCTHEHRFSGGGSPHGRVPDLRYVKKNGIRPRDGCRS